MGEAERQEGPPRRRHALATVVVGVVAVGFAAAAVATASPTATPTPPSPARSTPAALSGAAPAVGAVLARGGGTTLLAVTGDTLYVAGDALRAFDRRTGALLHALALPQSPTSLRVGPDGAVWLALVPDAAHRFAPAVWRFSPGLRDRVVLSFDGPNRYGAAPYDVLPTGANAAVVATDHGVARVTLPTVSTVPTPTRVHGTVDWGAFAGLPAYPLHVQPTGGGRLAVLLGNDAGSWLVAGAAGGWTAYDPGHAQAVRGVAASPEGLWVVRGSGPGDLVRLDPALHPLPVGPVASRLAPRGGSVWTYGRTVWVATATGLACFRWLGPTHPPSAALALGGEVTSVAATADDVYAVVAGAVRAYPVPPACRG